MLIHLAVNEQNQLVSLITVVSFLVLYIIIFLLNKSVF